MRLVAAAAAAEGRVSSDVHLKFDVSQVQHASDDSKQVLRTRMGRDYFKKNHQFIGLKISEIQSKWNRILPRCRSR